MILAFGREKNVGKDTAAMFVCEWLRSNYRNLSVSQAGFADPLYRFCEELYGWTGFRSKLYYNSNPAEKDLKLDRDPLGRTPRQILIGVAEKVREFDPEAFVTGPLHCPDPREVRIITDMRTPPEFERARSLGAILVRIVRPKHQPVGYTQDIDHLLAPYDDQWNHVLMNGGSLNDFHQTIMAFCERFLKPRLGA